MDETSKHLNGAAIRFLSGPLEGQTLPLEKQVTTIGRDAENDIVLLDQRVSRRHARISFLDGSWIIENLSERSNIAIDQQHTGQGTLKHESVVSLGNRVNFVFLWHQPTHALTSHISDEATMLINIVDEATMLINTVDEATMLINTVDNAILPPPSDSVATTPPASSSATLPIIGNIPDTPPVPDNNANRTIISNIAQTPPVPNSNANRTIISNIAQTPPVPNSNANRTIISNIAQTPPVSNDDRTLASIPPISLLPLALSKQGASETVLAPRSEKGTPSLSIHSNIHSERQVYLLNKQVQNIGRDAGNEIVINEPIVSAWHAQIIREGKNLFLVHPHPTRDRTSNGFWYRGQHIAGDQHLRQQLQSGDIFRIGDEHGTLVTLAYDAGVGTPVEQSLPEMAPIPLNSERLTIGRHADNTVVLNHPQVSGHHAALERVGAGYRIVDSNSTNHVYVNGELASNQLLRTSDEIRIGPYRFTYTGTELREYDESSHIRIDALHLRKSGNNNVILLNDISLVIPPRSFVALVGGSGAGKSTLLDALNGLRPAHDGTVLFNNVDYYHNLAAFNTQIGYVPQEDIVHRDLTIERALYYAARLRLPSDFTAEQIKWRIDEVLEDVEISERRHLLVSKLSGGQRKRVSIALELLANPGIFFLDEPTSGLDPGLDRKMMMLLRRLADRGRTIILVTHATNNINTCDYVCFLAQGGRLAYFGPPDEAKAFFDKTDFGEIYSTLEPTKEQPDIPEQAEQLFLQSSDYQHYVAGPLEDRQQIQAVERQPIAAGTESTRKRSRRGQGWSQFILLSQRYLELLKNDRGNLLILLLQAPVIAVMLVLMARFEIGSGIFDGTQLTQCSTQVLTTAGPLALPQARQTQFIACQQVLNFLQTAPASQAFVQQKGGLEQALQSFLVQGPGIDAQKVLFIMAFATVLFGCINGVREIVKEAPIYSRERMVNLGILPYMFSKIAILGLLCLLQSAVLTFVIELGEPLQQGIIFSPVLETYITLSLTSLAGLMIGLTISAIAPNNDRAISLVPLILLPQVIFSGAIIPLKDWFTQILATVFPTRWAMAALGSSIGLHADTTGGDRLFGTDYTYHSTLYSIYSQTDALHRLLLSWGSLGTISVVLCIVIGFFLKRKDVRV